MKRYVEFYEKAPVHVERESLHVEIRNMLTERNLPNCQRAYLELIEDLYLNTMALNLLYEQMRDLSKEELMEFMDRYGQLVKDSEKHLEKWENHLLRNTFCTGESCC